MEISYFESSLVKEKFAVLISKLHSVGFLPDYINQVITKSPFFDCFENNELNDFMSLSFEAITKEVFGREVIYDYSLRYVDDYYWAGLSIMEIMMNLEIPLKRILTIMSLQEIVGAYELYHEMNINKFLDHYLELENDRCLLKILRNNASLSIPNISFLTGIKLSLLKIMDYSNATLFATSFSNLSKLSILFNVSINIFKKKSNFIPFSKYMIRSKEFEPLLSRNILQYFNLDISSSYFTNYEYLEDKEIRNILKTNKLIIDLSNPFGVIYISSNRINKRYLSSEEAALIYKKSIDELRPQLTEHLF